MKSNILTVSNILTFVRLICCLVLVLISFYGQKNIFYVLFVAMLITDALDGFIARKTNQVSKFGAKLDGWVDLAMWSSALLCVWFLWPEIARREMFFALFALFAFSLPMIIGYIKFKEFPSYHCWSAKFQAVLMSIAVIMLIAFDIPWLFRIGAILQGLAAAEDIMITILLDEPRHDIPSIWHIFNENG